MRFCGDLAGGLSLLVAAGPYLLSSQGAEIFAIFGAQ